MVYEGTNKIYDFRKFKTIRAFGNGIRNNVIDMNMANEEQNELLEYVNRFKSRTKPNNPESKILKKYVLDNAKALLEGREMVFKAFESRIFRRLEKSQKGEGVNGRLKILTPNQMLKRLPIALAQVKAGNNSESLLNEIRQIVYSLHRSKEITKKVYNNIINSIKV